MTGYPCVFVHLFIHLATVWEQGVWRSHWSCRTKPGVPRRSGTWVVKLPDGPCKVVGSSRGGLSTLCFPWFCGSKKPCSIVFHFYRALWTLSCVNLKGAPQPNKTVESINEPNTLSLHILIICVTISLWPFSLGIYLMYSCKEMFCTGREEKMFTCSKSCHQDTDTSRDSFCHRCIIFLNTL